MKIKFNLDNSLTLEKMLELYNMLMFVRDVFHEGSKYFP